MLKPNLMQPRFISNFDQAFVIFSDIEMGSGGPYDDFPNSDFLGELLLSYLDGPYGNKPINFIFNGDTFDLLKTPYLGEYPRHINTDVAISKMSSIVAAHPKFFEAVRKISTHRSGNKHVYFVVGNHDMELLFPEVRDLITSLSGNAEHVHFPGFELDFGSIHIEHGSQLDPLFYVDETKPFVDYKGEKLLNISWASVALLDVIIPMQPILYHHDRLKPKKKVLEIFPEIKELLMGSMWQYYTRGFFKNYIFTDDPIKKVNWTMLKEIVSRFAYTEVDVQLEDEFAKKVLDENKYEVFISGHVHEMLYKSSDSGRVIKTGCFRDEFLIEDEHNANIPLLKNYIELFTHEGRLSGVEFKELLGPPRPEGTFLKDPSSILPLVREKLPDKDVQASEHDNQKEQERLEAKESRWDKALDVMRQRFSLSNSKEEEKKDESDEKKADEPNPDDSKQAAEPQKE